MSPQLNSVSLNEIKCRAADRKCSVQQQISLIHAQKEVIVYSITSSRKGFILEIIQEKKNDVEEEEESDQFFRKDTTVGRLFKVL